MELGLFLHFYQPSNQLESVFRDVYTQSYGPLLKLIQSFKNAKFTLNIPLSLLEQMDKFGYKDWIASVKDLYDQGRIELVGSGAYHPLMSKLQESFTIKQILLNEYGLGYYLGQHKGFEGESCVMIRDIRGFFPPEMAVSTSVIKVIDGLGYDWVLIDEQAVENISPHKGSLFHLKECKTKLVARDRTLSNMFAFNRSFDHTNIVEELAKSFSVRVIALDAETFGHHNKEGVYMLEALLIELYEAGHHIVSISDIVDSETSAELETVVESTWSTNVMLYPMWQLPNNQIHSLLWDLFDSVHEVYSNMASSNISWFNSYAEVENKEHLALWFPEELVEMPVDYLKKITLDMALMRLEQSDQFWWSSGVDIMGSKKFSPYMIESTFKYYFDVATLLEDKSLIAKVDSVTSDIKDLLKI